MSFTDHIQKQDMFSQNINITIQIVLNSIVNCETAPLLVVCINEGVADSGFDSDIPQV